MLITTFFFFFFLVLYFPDFQNNRLNCFSRLGSISNLTFGFIWSYSLNMCKWGLDHFPFLMCAFTECSYFISLETEACYHWVPNQYFQPRFLGPASFLHSQVSIAHLHQLPQRSSELSFICFLMKQLHFLILGSGSLCKELTKKQKSENPKQNNDKGLPLTAVSFVVPIWPAVLWLSLLKFSGALFQTSTFPFFYPKDYKKIKTDRFVSSIPLLRLTILQLPHFNHFVLSYLFE